MHFPQIHGSPLSHAAGVQCPGAPSQALRASSPRGRAFGRPRKVNGFARGSPTRGNGDDRRQWRKQGGAVGAAASRMRAAAKQTLGAATRPCRAKQTERLDEGEPFLCRKVRLLASPVSFWRIICYNGFAALPVHFMGREVKPNGVYFYLYPVRRSECSVLLHLQVA